MRGAPDDLIALLSLHSFDGGLWQFHATDGLDDDPTPTHALIALDNLVAPDLVDIAAIAKRLGVAKDTVHKWRYRNQLPHSDHALDMGPVWEWETIKAWAEATGRLERA